VLPGRSESFWGQLLAYAGVGGITVGTVFVVWGYFGGVEQYASTGWLIATAGQMLLLLGVVTLISGGMQQTTHEVGARIETLDGRIQRIEQSTHQLLKGPYFARRRRRTANSKRPPAA
jgi:sulfite exporter TauE/SafE